MKHLLKIYLFFLVSIGVDAAASNVCDSFLEKPVFTTSSLQSSSFEKNSFRLMQCSANWSSYYDAKKGGIDVTVPIYGIQVPINANWDNAKIDEWKSENCTEAEKNGDYANSLYKTVYSVDPISAKAALECYKASFAADATKALRCNLAENESSVVFEAFWRRTPGELHNPPVVNSFTYLNTNCINKDDLSSGVKLKEGGTSILCEVGEKASLFSLNTSRGSCYEAGAPQVPAYTFPSKLVLTNEWQVIGDRVVVPSNTIVVTNGNHFVLRADKLDLQGNLKILSYENPVSKQGDPGKHAAVVSIAAKSISGLGKVEILNAGTPGGNGAKGYPGNQGRPGKAGKPRREKWKDDVCGPLAALCDAIIFDGCTGGKKGGKGGRGGKGGTGNPGLPGGVAGKVDINVPASYRSSFAVMTDKNVFGKPQSCGGNICGGLGGAGGAGGDGGPGGEGGPGGPGTVHCGGTSGGPRGDKGPVGSKGKKGKTGTHAKVTFI